MDSTYLILVKAASTMNDPHIAILYVARAMAERGANTNKIIEVLGEAFVGNPRIKKIAENAIKQWGKNSGSKTISKPVKDVPRGRSVRRATGRPVAVA